MEAQNQVQLPAYKCHKVVRAMRIDRIEFDSDKRGPNEETDGSATVFDDTIHGSMRLDSSFLRKHNPLAVGGYIVVYEDGYKSFSPRQAFEEGYTRI